jgi:hypothetical protein
MSEKVNVTVEITPKLDLPRLREMVSRVVRDEMDRRRIRVTAHDTIEEALRKRHTGAGCVTCGSPSIYRCIHGRWCDGHRCDMSTATDRCGTTEGGQDGVTEATADQQRRNTLPAADDFPCAGADPAHGEGSAN